MEIEDINWWEKFWFETESKITDILLKEFKDNCRDNDTNKCYRHELQDKIKIAGRKIDERTFSRALDLLCKQSNGMIQIIGDTCDRRKKIILFDVKLFQRKNGKAARA